MQSRSEKAMAKPTENSVTWGTLEELLLACAVNRYGTNCWDSVAKEIQKRTSAFHLLTPQNCKQKYHDLKRRFTTQNDGGSAHAPPMDTDGAATADSGLWLEELRRLRIAELKRELQRYDVSIVSLQLKVKKLKEERELSLKENQKEESDLEKKNQERENDEDDKEEEKENIPESSSPDFRPVDGVPGGDSDRESQSVNESNSTDPKGGSLDDRVDRTRKEPSVPVAGQPDPVEGTEKPASEASCDGSSDTISPAQKSTSSQDRNSAKSDSVKERVDSLELRESVAESKGGGEEEGTKESSDVQSSANLSRKLGGEKVISGCNSGGDEPEAENQSLGVKHSNCKSQPLIDFLELIESHKLGSMFEHRLESQDTSKYKNLIRQHVDLRTIRTRLEGGQYSDCHTKLYRDVLLLLNNAAVYFARNSSEHKAAIELRQLITKRLPHNGASKKDPDAPPLRPTQPKPESELTADSFLLKPKLSGGPVIACRKRSSIVAKSSAGGGERKKDTAGLNKNDEKEIEEKEKEKEKASVDVKLPEKTSFSAVTKKRTRDQRLIASRNSSKNSSGSFNIESKSRTNNPPNKNSDGSGNENSSEAKLEKKNSSSNAATNASNVKKQSVANFLNRMRRSSSSSNNGSLLDSLKNSGASAESTKGTERKRSGGGGGKSGGTKDQNTSRKGSASKPVKEKEKEEETRERGSAVSRKNAGRPPKRAAALAVAGKKRREGGGQLEPVPKKRARK
ncbi:hypothetical protein Ancab_030943 [Ancistrocladus abbreviatus]